MTRGKVVPDPAALPYHYVQSFFALGTQYYGGARLLFFARAWPVTGNLAHHAVEMFLKGVLCLTVPIEVLASPKFGHSLTRVWLAFKEKVGEPALDRFDATIAMLDPFEELRYPDKVYGFAVQSSIEPTEPMPTPWVSRNFQFVLRDLDALVQSILVQASQDPIMLAARLNKEGRAALARDNATGIWTERSEGPVEGAWSKGVQWAWSKLRVSVSMVRALFR